MTLNELVTSARSDILDDAVAPYLWSDSQLTRFAKEAVIEACKRAPILADVFTLTVTAAKAEYTLDGTVKQIYTAKLDSVTSPLDQTTVEELALFVGSSWRTITGTPTRYVRRGDKLTLYPIPTANDALVVSASIVPSMDSAIDFFGIDEKYHHGFVYYIAYKAYSLRDEDTQDGNKAADYLDKFNQFFGLPKSAKWQITAQETPLYAFVIGGRLC